MMYVGIDLHRKRSHITAMDEDGQVALSHRVDNDPDAVRALLAAVGPEAQIALEATYGWGWLAELLKEEGYDLRPRPPAGHPGDRPGQDRRGGLAHAGPLAARGPAARGRPGPAGPDRLGRDGGLGEL